MQGFCAKTLAPVTLMEGKMYREDKQQLAFKDFYLPFGGGGCHLEIRNAM
jgi:hypothetical protein